MITKLLAKALFSYCQYSYKINEKQDGFKAILFFCNNLTMPKRREIFFNKN